jgi:hypothetical protein
MQGCRPRPGRGLRHGRAWGRVRPHARGYAARWHIPGRLVVVAFLGGPTLAASVSVRLSPDYAATRARLAVCPRSRRGWRCPTPSPLRSTPSASGTDRAAKGVTLRAWPLPAFRSAAWSVVPPLRPVTGPPLPSSRVRR